MWIMTPFGIIMPTLRPTNTVNYGDDCTMQVRARDKRALEYLRDHYMEAELGSIIHTPEFDYEYRAYCKPNDFAWAVHNMIIDIDYEKFKPNTLWQDLHDLYNKIWGTVYVHYNPSFTKTRKQRKTPKQPTRVHS